MGSLTVCEAALREGLIVDWMIGRGLIADRLRYQGSVRERSVLQLADKFNLDTTHAEQVTRLSLSLLISLGAGCTAGATPIASYCGRRRCCTTAVTSSIIRATTSIRTT